MAEPKQIACGNCGTTITFTLEDVPVSTTKSKQQSYKNSGTGEPPSGGLLSVRHTKEEICPSCGESVWMEYDPPDGKIGP